MAVSLQYLFAFAIEVLQVTLLLLLGLYVFAVVVTPGFLLPNNPGSMLLAVVPQVTTSADAGSHVPSVITTATNAAIVSTTPRHKPSRL